MQLIQSWLGSGWNIILVILGLGLIVFLHELGHFLMAKKNKVRVEVFSLGFGQAIFKFRRGETEYRIAWLPLGGYVKMAGETLMDDHKGEDFELTSKTPWQRFQIFVAGAVMNLLLAFPIAMLSYVVGKCEAPNIVGMPGNAEANAGIRTGDQVLEVDGRKIDSLDKFRIEMIRHSSGTKVPVVVRREGEKELLTIPVQVMRSSFHHSFSVTTMLPAPAPGSELLAKGVLNRDEIVSVDGKKVYSGKDADALLRANPEKDVTLGILTRDAAFQNDAKEPRQITLRFKKKTWYAIPYDEYVQEARVSAVEDFLPADGSLKPKDQILQINDRKIASWGEMKEMVEASDGKPLEITILREQETKKVTVTPFKVERGGILGIHPLVTNVFATVREGSFFYKAGIRSGDKLVEIAGHGGDVTMEGLAADKIPAIMPLRESEPKTIPIVVDRKGERIKIDLVAEAREEADLAAAGFKTEKGMLVCGESQPFRRRPFGDAIKLGLQEPVDITVMTVDMLRKLVTGGESAKHLSGPIGIAQASYKFAELNFGNFLWLLCLITVNLGVFNLLPIPILDGGHNVLLLIEVVRKWFGKPPPSEKFIAGFQYIGLAFILTLFVWVTYHDISRLFGARG